MFHVRGEGEEIRPGFNFYPRSEWNRSRGFVLRAFGCLYWVRYSPSIRRWHLARHKVGVVLG